MCCLTGFMDTGERLIAVARKRWCASGTRRPVPHGRSLVFSAPWEA